MQQSIHLSKAVVYFRLDQLHRGFESEDHRRGKFPYHDPDLRRQSLSAVVSHEKRTYGVFRETKGIERKKDGCRGNARGTNQERRRDEDVVVVLMITRLRQPRLMA
jgi:hypothetical protein